VEEDLTTDLSILQSHLDGMLDRVQHNSLTLKRLQSFEMRLLALTSLAEMIRFILGEAKDLFDLDIISLCLIDFKGEISSHLTVDNYPLHQRDGLLLVKDDQLFKSHFMLPGRPLLGIYQEDNFTNFFSENQQPASVVLVPLIRRGKYFGSLNLGSQHAERFIGNMATDFVEHLASVVSICLENILNFEMLRLTSLVDPLTGVNNRRFLEQRIEEELDRSLRTREPLSCLFLDIDFFKSINDQYGHQGGDQVLAQIAAAIKKQLRSNDVLARYGGEEFVALMSQSNNQSACEIAERIRASVENLSIGYGNQTIPVTLSVGSATFTCKANTVSKPVAEIAAKLIQSADDALYQAKRNGRNRVENSGLI
jgi:diguanylate cyclase (GGDEF)-like protein